MTTAPATHPDSIMGRALSARAANLIAALGPNMAPAPDEAIDLTTPETATVPEPVQAAAADALDRGETHYTTRPGVTPLREAIARKMTAEGFPTTADGMLITNGGSEALYIALQTLLGPGKKILVAGPAQPNIIEMIRFIGADPVRSPVGQRFFPDAATIAATDAAALLLASPSPVTGLALRPGELENLIEPAIQRGMTVFLDRSLGTALYDPALARFNSPELGARVVTIGSFSTGHGLSGWRVGWLTAPPEVMNGPRELKQDMSICTTAVSQYAALAFLDMPDSWVTSRRQAFAGRRDRAIKSLRGSLLLPVAPDAYPALLVDVRATDDDDRRFASRLLDETGVIVQPASSFGPATAGHIRIDLSAPGTALREGVARMASFAAEERPS